MRRPRLRDWLVAAACVGLGAVVFLAWIRPGAVRSVLAASVGAWCS